MQGQRGAIGSLPESLAFEHGSTSNEPSVVEPQICWPNNMRNPPPNGLSDYPNSSQMYPNSTNQETQSVNLWSIGEAGSSSNQGGPSHIEPKMDHGWPALSKAYPEPHHYEPPSSMLSLGDVNMTGNGRHGSDHPAAHNIIVNPSTFIGLKSSNPSETYLGSTYLGSTASGSSAPNLFGPVSDPSNFESHRPKRKAVELSAGQSSSGIESSNPFQRAEGNTSVWRDPIEANSTPSDHIIPSLGLGIEGVVSENPLVENTHRNVRSRVDASSGQQDPLLSNNSIGQFNFSSPYPSFRLNPDNPSSHEGQPILRLPALRRNSQASSRWNRSSSSRANRSSNVTLPTDISDHPIFIQPTETRTDGPNGVNWLTGGGSSARATGSSSGAAPTSATPGSNPHRGSAHYPSRRLSEILRRSLLNSADSETNIFSRIPPPVGRSASSSSSQDTGIPIEGHHRSRSSLLLDRRLDGAFAFPYLSRSGAAGTEGRGRLVSELRNVLDLMRRGEGLRFEDVMILDPSVFYGVADMHDRHRDMRLDIDNMSYEELLALEERIGNVNTGLTEETISNRLKQKKYTTATGQLDVEPCCVCQEEYNDGDDLGALECGHEFHANCIKKWLTQKNLCPVCKSTAFATPK